MSEGQRVVKVKITPYPIGVVFGIPPSTSRGKIVKLTMMGFLAEVDSPYFTVREKYEAQFTLPVVGTDFKEAVVVIKTYDRLGVKIDNRSIVHRMIEFHFVKLTDPNAVQDFLNKIGQTK